MNEKTVDMSNWANYIIFFQEDPDDLAGEINNAIKYGYVPVGSPFCGPLQDEIQFIHQAMIKDSK